MVGLLGYGAEARFDVRLSAMASPMSFSLMAFHPLPSLPRKKESFLESLGAVLINQPLAFRALNRQGRALAVVKLARIPAEIEF